MTVEKIRISTGSAAVLGLRKIEQKAVPSTCYLMTFRDGHCTANCSFCPQARDLQNTRQLLSRVSWPVFPFQEFMIRLESQQNNRKFKRTCIQTLNYPGNTEDLVEIVTRIRNVLRVPFSAAVPPLPPDQMKRLKQCGIQRIGIALDGATPAVFDAIKGKGAGGPYRWEGHLRSLRDALEIFTPGHVSTHLIAGLGETEKEMLERIQELKDLQVLPGLFAFMPVKGTMLEKLKQPDLVSYRKIQLGRFLILTELKSAGDFIYDRDGSLTGFTIDKKRLHDIVESSDAFLTSGCPGCNRPYYTSRPSGPMYNYPGPLTETDKQEVCDTLTVFVD
jgi:biotin synthase